MYLEKYQLGGRTAVVTGGGQGIGFACAQALGEAGARVILRHGPFADDTETEWSGEGMIIVRAASLADAVAIANADPMHSAGVRSFRVRPWLLNEGSYTVTVRYSEAFRAVG